MATPRKDPSARHEGNGFLRAFTRSFTGLADRTAHASGTPVAFSLAILAILVWGVTGPLFGFSDTWQLILNTGTNIITFLMVFLIENTQNRDSLAIHAKLDELVRAVGDANKRFIGIEKATEAEVERMRAGTEPDDAPVAPCEDRAP